MSNPGWIEPEEGWNPWRLGQVMLDKRSELLVEIVEVQLETFDEGDDWDGSPTERRYFSYRIIYVDDGKEPMGGSWRAPEDLDPMNAMEILAHAAR